MSWSASFEVERDGSVGTITKSGISGLEATAQYKVAYDAAIAIIGTHGVGFAKRFKVSLNGHANPGHEPVSGWSNDSVSVSVYQLEETVEDR